MSNPNPTHKELKTSAKNLRAALAQSGHSVSHSQSLELLAKQLGHRDWNTLHASVGNAPSIPYHVGQRVSGSYLGQSFEGEIIALRNLTGEDHFGVTVQFDDAVDVVTFEGMSNFRSRVSAVVNRAGVTAEKSGNGQPQMVLNG